MLNKILIIRLLWELTGSNRRPSACKAWTVFNDAGWAWVCGE